MNRGLYDKAKNILQDHHKCLFVQGAGGCGKTYTYNKIIKYCERRGIGISCYAYTGIAASLLHEGKTLHSGFSLPLNQDVSLRNNVKRNSIQWQRLENTNVILIDEISMVPKKILEFIDFTMRDIKRTTENFGGCVILCGGDMRQTLPVIVGANESKIVSNCIVKSRFWNDFVAVKLTKMFEQDTMKSFPHGNFK